MARQSAADVAAIERQVLECDMERIALDLKCIELQRSLEALRRRHRRRVVGRAATTLAEALDRTVAEQKKVERVERERLRVEREHQVELARQAKQRETERRRIAEQHKMAEEEAAKKRQMELEMEERRRAVLEQAAKEQHDDVVRQADADERRMRQKAAQQERRIAGTMKAPAKAAVPEEAAAFVQRTADDRKAAKQREMPHDVDTSLEPARPATPAPSVSKPARATKPSGAKKRKQQKSSKDDLDDGGGAPINAPSAAKKQRVATESDPDKRATESDPVKRATATTKSASVDAAMEDEHASDSVGFSEAKAIQPQKPRKGKKKNMMKELAAQEKQRRKEAARKEKLEKYALAVKKKQDELAAKRAKAAAKPVVQSRPTHGDDTSVIAKPKAKSSKTAQPAAEKQQSAPQPIALGEGASSDDEPSGLSLFDRMAQKMRQQILAKEGGAAKAPAPPKHVPAKPTPSPNDAPPKRSILSSIFSVPLLKKP